MQSWYMVGNLAREYHPSHLPALKRMISSDQFDWNLVRNSHYKNRAIVEICYIHNRNYSPLTAYINKKFLKIMLITFLKVMYSKL